MIYGTAFTAVLFAVNGKFIHFNNLFTIEILTNPFSRGIVIAVISTPKQRVLKLALKERGVASVRTEREKKTGSCSCC